MISHLDLSMSLQGAGFVIFDEHVNSLLVSYPFACDFAAPVPFQADCINFLVTQCGKTLEGVPTRPHQPKRGCYPIRRFIRRDSRLPASGLPNRIWNAWEVS